MAEVARKSPDGLDYLINMSGAVRVMCRLPGHRSTSANLYLLDCPHRHRRQRVCVCSGDVRGRRGAGSCVNLRLFTACVCKLKQPALRSDGDDYVRVLTVNTVGSFRMTKNFLPLLRCALCVSWCRVLHIQTDVRPGSSSSGKHNLPFEQKALPWSALKQLGARHAGRSARAP